MDNRLANPSVGRLFSGIVSDAEDLVQQQLALFKEELKEEARTARRAAIPAAIGAFVLLLGVVLLCFAAVHLLDYLTEELPLWACFAIVALVLGVAGGIALGVGLKKLGDLTPVADKSVAELKENVRWLTKPN
jgi:MFS family permease